MFDATSVRRGFGRAAGEYVRHAVLQRQVRGRAVARLGALLTPGERWVLDLGCGPGELAEEVQGRGWRVVGVDVSEAMCREARRRGAMAVVGDGGAIPAAEGAFDAVVSSLMVQWVDDVAGVMREVRRVLRPGGVAVLTTLVEGTLVELRRAYESAGLEARVSDFAREGEVVRAVVGAGLVPGEVVRERAEQRYGSVVELMRAVRGIGASDHRADRPRGLTTPGKLARVEGSYPRREGERGVTATWEVLTVVARRE